MTTRSADGTDPMNPSRSLAAWTAAHDNGWTTGATENPDGTFAAWATQTGDTAPITAEYIEDGLENAMRAAVYALEQKTRHPQCSPRCSGWRMHTHPHGP
jgi:hypothetical protein